MSHAYLLLADEDQITRAFLAENVARHIFGLLGRTGYVPALAIGLLLTAVGSVAQGRWGT